MSAWLVVVLRDRGVVVMWCCLQRALGSCRFMTSGLLQAGGQCSGLTQPGFFVLVAKCS